MYHPIVKEQVLPGQLEELQTNPHATETQFQSQAEMKENKKRGAVRKNRRWRCDLAEKRS
jgi:hypothetical protein